MSKGTEPTKTESVLAAIYDDSLALPKENEENPVSEEKKHNPIPTDSNEGKLKLFLGGLYFQTERTLSYTPNRGYQRLLQKHRSHPSAHPDHGQDEYGVEGIRVHNVGGQGRDSAEEGAVHAALHQGQNC